MTTFGLALRRSREGLSRWKGENNFGRQPRVCLTRILHSYIVFVNCEILAHVSKHTTQVRQVVPSHAALAVPSQAHLAPPSPSAACPFRPRASRQPWL